MGSFSFCICLSRENPPQIKVAWIPAAEFALFLRLLAAVVGLVTSELQSGRSRRDRRSLRSSVTIFQRHVAGFSSFDVPSTLLPTFFPVVSAVVFQFQPKDPTTSNSQNYLRKPKYGYEEAENLNIDCYCIHSLLFRGRRFRDPPSQQHRKTNGRHPCKLSKSTTK